MTTETIGHVAEDYLSFQAGEFVGQARLAGLARRLFLDTPGFNSFEVSPSTGHVFIGLDRDVLMRQDANQAAVKLLRDYFPDVVASQEFCRVYPGLH